MTSFYIGIDPDLHHAGIVLLGPGIASAWVAKIASDFKGEQANVAMANAMTRVLRGIAKEWGAVPVIVESQRIRPGSNVNPQDIVMLAQAAGVAVGVASAVGLGPTFLVQPQDWKGTMPKEQCTDMLCRHFFPEASQGAKHIIAGAHASHVLDAAGLAAWGWLRDLLPRAEGSTSTGGVVLNRQRLSRLPPLSLRLAGS